MVRVLGRSRWRLDWAPTRPNWAHIAVWIVFFGTMTLTGRTDGRHTGDSLPFWQQACEEGRRNASEIRFQAGCVNVLDPESPSRANPRAIDLQLLLREGGRNLTEMSEPDLFARACDHGWTFACEGGTRSL